MKRLAGVLAAAVLALGTIGPVSAMGSRNFTGRGTVAERGMAAAHIQIRLATVGGSGVMGIADLAQLRGGGTRITVLAFGLQPGNQYVSLYYDNHVCQLEPYSVSDVIGGIYTANAGGVGATRGMADDNLAAINSVSVREAGTFTLLACGNVHP